MEYLRKMASVSAGDSAISAAIDANTLMLSRGGPSCSLAVGADALAVKGVAGPVEVDGSANVVDESEAGGGCRAGGAGSVRPTSPGRGAPKGKPALDPGAGGTGGLDAGLTAKGVIDWMICERSTADVACRCSGIGSRPRGGGAVRVPASDPAGGGGGAGGAATRDAPKGRAPPPFDGPGSGPVPEPTRPPGDGGRSSSRSKVTVPASLGSRGGDGIAATGGGAGEEGAGGGAGEDGGGGAGGGGAGAAGPVARNGVAG